MGVCFLLKCNVCELIDEVVCDLRCWDWCGCALNLSGAEDLEDSIKLFIKLSDVL